MKKSGSREAVRFDGWWTTPVERWAEVSDTIFKQWHRFERAKPRPDDAVALIALAFGFGARSAYGQHRAWKDLTEQLEADWRQAGHEAANPWVDIRTVVKRGWTAAADVQSILEAQALAEPSEAEPSAEQSPAETRVPGGRMDGHHA